MGNIIGNVIIGIGLVFVLFGVVGIFRFKNFFSRILVASKVDTVGFITIMIGVIVRQGLSYFSLKVALIALIMLLINPLITHSITRSAHYSGYKVRKEE